MSAETAFGIGLAAQASGILLNVFFLFASWADEKRRRGAWFSGGLFCLGCVLVAVFALTESHFLLAAAQCFMAATFVGALRRNRRRPRKGAA